jgi:hypothetical protein
VAIVLRKNDAPIQAGSPVSAIELTRAGSPGRNRHLDLGEVLADTGTDTRVIVAEAVTPMAMHLAKLYAGTAATAPYQMELLCKAVADH